MNTQRMRRTALVLFVALLQISQVGAADSFERLVAAIQAANSSGSGAITLSADIVLTAPLPPITGEIMIDGGGHTLSGDGKHRIFEVNGGRLKIRRLNLAQGRAPEGEDGGAMRLGDGAKVTIDSSEFVANSAASGGAIAISGSTSQLTLIKSRFRQNYAASSAGVVDVTGASVTVQRSSFVQNIGLGGAGAIRAYASILDISNSTFSENWSKRGAGALESRAGSNITITHATFRNDQTSEGAADVIENAGAKIRLRNSIIAGAGDADDCMGALDENIGNLSPDGTCATRSSGDPLLGELLDTSAYHPPRHHSPALDNAKREFCLERDQIGAPRPIGAGCDIGAIESRFARPAPDAFVPPPACTLRDNIIAANTDAPVGGCPAGRGADVIVIDRDIRLSSRLPTITSEIIIEGRGSTISGSRHYRIFDVDGGKLTINNLILTQGNDSIGGGGAIRLRNGANVTVNHSRFIKNSAWQGGAIAVPNNETAGYTLALNNSSFLGNRAARGGGAIALMFAAGARVSITNSSFVDNQAADTGGAIMLLNATQLAVDNSTFFANRAGFAGHVFSLEGGPTVTLTQVTMAVDGTEEAGHAMHLRRSIAGYGTVRLRNSIVHGMALTNDCDSLIRENVRNLVSDGSCSPMLRGDALLAEPSGDPVYLPLKAGSPAIDAADARFCPATDQAGNPRPLGAGCDIGAIEAQPVVYELSNCSVTTTHALNFRAGPGGSRIGLVAQHATVRATARTPGWFQVEYEGRTGWISADYAVTEGDCG